MALIRCTKCKGNGKHMCMGGIRRTCAVCEGAGQVSDIVIGKKSSEKTKSKKVVESGDE